MRLILVLLLGVFSTQYAAAQPNLDSLWGVWQDQSQLDTTRLKALHQFASNGYLRTEPDSAFYYGGLMLDYAEAKELKSPMADALHLQAYALANLGQYNEAVGLYERSLSIREEIGDLVGVAMTLNNLGSIHRKQGDIEKALRFQERSLSIRQELGNQELISGSLQNIGSIYKSLGDYEKALSYYNESLTIDRKIGNKNGQANSLNKVGIIYYNQGNLAKAIDFWVQSLSIKEELGNKRGAANSLSNIGVIYENQKEYAKALEYYERSLELREEIGDKRGIAISLSNMGVVYEDLLDFDKAYELYDSSLLLKQEMGDKGGVALALNNMAEIHRKKAEFQLAIEIHERSLALRTEVGDRERMASSLGSLGWTYLDMGDYDKAIAYSNRALEIGQEVGVAIEIRNSAKQLYEGYKGVGNKPKALEMYELYISTRDSIDSEDNHRQVLRHEYEYQYEKEALTDSLEFSKKEAVLQERTEKQRLGLFAAGGGLLLVLALAFAIYSGKKKSDELLLNILPYETAQELKKKGHSDAKLIDEVTVLFTDFKGFTAMAEQLSAKDLVEDLNICFSEFDRIMEKYGIEKIKTIGDAYMAAGGLPVPNSTHAHDVVKAAFEMRDFVEAGKSRKIEQGLPYFEVRIGVHTGPVVAGIVGIKKFQYDIWGDTVNTASRMESSGEAGKVNVSETTYNLVKDDFLTMPRGEIEAKGKGKVKMYFVENNA